MTTPAYPDTLQLLIAGQVQSLASRLSDHAALSDPSGNFSGRDAVLAFLTAKSAELRSEGARAERVRLTVTPPRAADEQVLHFTRAGQEIHLPYAIVLEAQPDGKLSAIRVYHSHWPLLHGHRLRPAILPEDKSLVLSDVIARYQQALTAGDTEGVMNVFEDDGYAREPAGNEYVYQGKAALRPFYSGLFAFGKGGGIPLQHCTATDDGVACALEYNVVELGGQTLTPQAGVAVYERGASGKLHAARIYDDIALE